jgi:hypothetical protein
MAQKLERKLSTYYYMICDGHKERTQAASRTMMGIGTHLCDSEFTLLAFIVAHAGCPVRIVSEHEYEAYSDDYEDWTRDNYSEMALKERDD